MLPLKSFQTILCQSLNCYCVRDPLISMHDYLQAKTVLKADEKLLSTGRKAVFCPKHLAFVKVELAAYFHTPELSLLLVQGVIQH